jgi:YaiO family outer membrane protein
MSWTRILPIVLVVLSTVGDSGLASAQGEGTESTDLLVTRAVRLRQRNRKVEALAEMQRAVAQCPQCDGVLKFRDLLQHEVHGLEATLGIAYQRWDDARAPIREPQIALRKNTMHGPAIVRFSRLSRFGLNDTKAELEAYPALPGGYGALGVGVASRGTLYARSAISLELFESLPGRLEGSLGYRRLNFPHPVNVSTASLGKYLRSYLIGARIHGITGGGAGTSISLTARRYFSDDGQFIGAQVSAGSIREDVRTVADLDALSSRSLGVDALVIVKARLMLTARGSFGRDKLTSGVSAGFSALTLGVGVRF